MRLTLCWVGEKPNEVSPLNAAFGEVIYYLPQQLRSPPAKYFNHILEHMTGDWLLWLEAGETLSPESLSALKACLGKTQGYCPVRVLEKNTQFERIENRWVQRDSGVHFQGKGHPRLQIPLAHRLKKPAFTELPQIQVSGRQNRPWRKLWQKAYTAGPPNAQETVLNHSLWLTEALRLRRYPHPTDLAQKISAWKTYLNPDTLGPLPEAERCLIEALHFYLGQDLNIEKAYHLFKQGQACFPNSPQVQYFASIFLSLQRDYPSLLFSLRQLEKQLNSPHPYHRWLKLYNPDYLNYLNTLASHFQAKSNPDLVPLASTKDLLQSQTPSKTLLRWGAQQDRIRYRAQIFGSLDYHYLSYLIRHENYPSPAWRQAAWQLGQKALAKGQTKQAKWGLTHALANRMASQAKLALIWELAHKNLQAEISGDWVELGSYRGDTSLLLSCLLRHFAPTKKLHVYDSFQGLPAKSEYEAQSPYPAGSCASSQAEFEANFAALAEPLPQIHPGWFSETLPQQLPQQMGLAFLDGDFYDSISQSLAAVYPRLQPGALVILDDYHSPALPGVAKACEIFLNSCPEMIQTVSRGRETLAYFLKV